MPHRPERSPHCGPSSRYRRGGRSAAVRRLSATLALLLGSVVLVPSAFLPTRAEAAPTLPQAPGETPGSGGATQTPGLPTILGINDLSSILDIAQGYGNAELTKTESGDPVIVGDINGTAYQLFFLDCTTNRDCQVLNFYAIWDLTDVDLGKLNDWNRARPFHKSYLTEDDFPVVELNLSTAGGITSARLSDAFDRWTVALAEFQSQVLDQAF